MKRNIAILMTALTALVFSSCVKSGKGSILKKTYTPGAFNMVDLDGSGDVVLIRDSSMYVEVETYENLFDIVKVEVKNNHVVLGIKNSYSLGGNNKLVYYVHAPSIIQVGVDGSGNIKGGSDGIINGNTFATRITGSGNIEIEDIVVPVLEATIAGSGNIRLTGNSTKSTFQVSGSGDIRAFGINSDDTDATISGSGNIETTTLHNLNAVISGSGNIRYKGTPVVNVNIGGSGSVINAN